MEIVFSALFFLYIIIEVFIISAYSSLYWVSPSATNLPPILASLGLIPCWQKNKEFIIIILQLYIIIYWPLAASIQKHYVLAGDLRQILYK
jgi:hypothetical protein